MSSVSRNGVVRVGQIWQDRVGSFPRRIKITDIVEGIHTGREYAHIVISRPGFHPGSKRYYTVGDQGSVWVELFTGMSARYTLVTDVDEVKAGQVYRDSTRHDLVPRLVKIISVGSEYAYVEILTPGHSRLTEQWQPAGTTGRIRVARFRPGPEKAYELYLADETYIEFVRKMFAKPEPKPEAPDPAAGKFPGQVFHFRPTADWSRRTTSPGVLGAPYNLSAEGLQGYAKTFFTDAAKTEYDLIKKVAPDYVPFFNWLDKAKPEWRTNADVTIRMLSDLLAAYDAGRESR